MEIAPICNASLALKARSCPVPVPRRPDKGHVPWKD